VKVLFVVPSFAPAWCYGGPVVSNLNLARELRAQGFDVRVLTTNANGKGNRLTSPEQFELIASLGVPVTYCNVSLGEDISIQFVAALLRAVASSDVVYLTGVFSYHPVLTIASCRLIGRGLVWAPRGSLQHLRISRRSGAKRFFIRLLSSIVPSKTIMHYTSMTERDASSSLVPRLASVVIANGCPNHTIKKCTSAESSSEVRALFLGRISPSKGLDLILRALGLLTADELDRITFTIVGEGDQREFESLTSLAGGLGLTSVVHWIGPVYDSEAKSELMTRFNLGIFASKGENFGNSIIELLGNGIPVLLSDNLPWADVERQGCGIVVPRTEQSFAAALKKIISNPTVLVEMGHRGVDYSRGLPTWRDAGVALGKALEEARR
jgi:glycosyltransferase involved in cell wall biosynthesis